MYTLQAGEYMIDIGEYMIDIIVLVCFTSVMLNLCILGFLLKLYVEYFKDRSITKRGERDARIR